MQPLLRKVKNITRKIKKNHAETAEQSKRSYDRDRGVVQSLQPDVRPHSMEISVRVVPRLLNVANGGMIETQIDGKL